jgi:signal transduction histidine kinase
VQLRVRDSGPGLPAGDPTRLFDRFYRAGDSGSGLGLAIVKVLVKLHGGSVRAADQAGGGAVFTL